MDTSAPPPIPPPPLPPRPARSGFSTARIIVAVGLLAGIGLFLAVVLGLFVPAIVRAREKAARMRAESVPETPAAAPAPLSTAQEEQAMAFAHELASRAGDDDLGWISRHLDIDAYVRRCIETLPRQTLFRTQLYKDLRTTPGGFFASLACTGLHPKRFHYREGHPAVVVRFEPDEGVGFVDLILRPEKDSFRIIDVFSYANGRTLSADMRETLSLLLGPDPETLRRLLGVTKLDKADADQLASFMNSLGEEDWTAVLVRYKALTPELRRVRTVHLGHIVALQRRTGDDPKISELYAKALAESADILGPESISGLLGVDLHTMRGEYAEVIRCVDSVTAVVGPDAHLQLLRANANVAAGKLGEAEADIRRGLELEPEFTALIPAKIELLIRQERYPLVIEELDACNAVFKRFGVWYTTEDFVEDSYESFRASPEYKAWAEKNPAGRSPEEGDPVEKIPAEP